MAITIGELLVNLRASTAAFAKDLDKATQLSFDTSKEIQRSFTVIGTAIAAGLATAAAGITAAVVKALESADQMGKLAQKTGETVEQFSGLAYAAKLADVPVESLSRGLVTLAKNLEKSNQQTLEGKAATSALATLFQGAVPKFKDTNDAFEQIATRLALLPDGFQKTALAAQIFGAKNTALIPLLNASADGIHKMVAEAQQFGLVVSQETAAKAELFNDTLKRVSSVLDGLALKLAAELLPHLQEFANDLLEISKNTSQAGDRIAFLKTLVQLLATVVFALAGALNVLGNIAGFVATAIEEAITDPLAKHPEDGVAALRASWEQLSESFTSSVSRIQQVWSEADHATESLRKMGTASLPAGLTEQQKKLQASLEQVTDKLKDEIIAFQGGADFLERYKLEALGATQAQLEFVESLQNTIKWLKEGLDPTTGFAKEIDTMSVSVGEFVDNTSKLERGNQIWLETRNNIEKMAGLMIELNDLLQLGAIDQDTYNRAVKQYGDELGLIQPAMKKVDDFSKQLRKDLINGFAEAIVGARSFKDAIIDLIQQIGELIIKALILQPLFDFLGGLGGPGSILGTIFGGGKAMGGSVTAGMRYRVGEFGPEEFVPFMSGSIVPAGNGGGTVYNIDARGADASVEWRIRRAISESESRAVARSLSAVKESSLRNA